MVTINLGDDLCQMQQIELNGSSRFREDYQKNNLQNLRISCDFSALPLAFGAALNYLKWCIFPVA
jgi:hypothetical protein